MKCLSKSCTAFACDRAGYGISGIPPRELSSQWEDIGLLCREIEPDIILAHSSGFIPVLEATAHGIKTGKMLLFEPLLPSLITDPEILNDIKVMKRFADEGKEAQALLSLVEILGRDPEGKPMSDEEEEHIDKNMHAFFSAELRGYLSYNPPADSVPDMIIGYGTKRPGADRAAPILSLAQRLHAPICSFPGAHNSPHDQPEAFADWVLDKSVPGKK
jgi:hypothetical protein